MCLIGLIKNNNYAYIIIFIYFATIYLYLFQNIPLSFAIIIINNIIIIITIIICIMLIDAKKITTSTYIQQ